MKYNAVPLFLLLLGVANVCLGRALPGRGRYETSSAVLNNAFKDVSSDKVAGYDPPEAFRSLEKRTIPKLKPGDVEQSPSGSSKGGQAGNGQSGGSGQHGDGQQAPNDQYGGDKGTSSDPPPTTPLKPATDPAIVPALPQAEVRYTAPKPAGMTEEDLKLWNAIDDIPLGLGESDQMILWAGKVEGPDMTRFQKGLAGLDPNTNRNFVSSWEATAWNPAFKPYGGPQWKRDGIFSIKFAEACANRPEPIHVLYGSSDFDNLPPNAWLTLAEIGIVTGPGSKVQVVYRWDKDTFDGSIVPGVLWKAGDPPLAPPLADLSKDPKDPEVPNPDPDSKHAQLASGSSPDVPSGAASPANSAPEANTGPVPNSSPPGTITEPVINSGNPGTASPPSPERVPEGSETGSSAGSEAGGCLPCVGRSNCVCM